MNNGNRTSAKSGDENDGVARVQPGNLERNVKSRSTWTRLLFMLVMGFAWSIAVMVTSFAVVLNFFYLLFTGSTNSKLTSFGHSLATYLYQIIEYMTFNSDRRPFPFDDDFPAKGEAEENARNTDDTISDDYDDADDNEYSEHR